MARMHPSRAVLLVVALFMVAATAVAADVPLRMRLRPSGRVAARHAVRPAVASLLQSHGLPTRLATQGANLPINGSVWPVGGFETEIFLGTPPQPTLVQIDTGSSDLLVAQRGCLACPTPKYNPAASSTSQTVGCHTSDFICKSCAGPAHNLCFYNNTYETCDYSDPTASCSLVGTTFYDVASLTPGSGVSTVVGFGGIQNHTGAFDNEWTNMPGVMGMGYPHLAAVWRDHTTFDAWVAAGELEAVFGMCLTKTGGLITLGDVDASLYKAGTMQYTPVIEKAWYVLHMMDLSVAGKSVGLPVPSYNKIGTPPGTILDSGTNTFVISGDAYAIVAEAMEAMCPETMLHGICDAPKGETLFDGACFAMTAAQISAYPSVEVTLNGTAPLGIYGEQYLIAHPEKEGHYCMGIQSSGPGGFTILGNVFQSGFYVVFDQVNSRLGFAEPNFDSCHA